MKTRTEIQHVVFSAIRRVAPEANPDTLDPSANLRKALDIDSFDFLRVIIAISEELQIAIPERDYSEVLTLKGLVDYIEARSR